MIKKIDKNEERKQRAKRQKSSIRGSAKKPRLSVYRSLNNIYAQLIDDDKGVTVASANTLQFTDKELAGKTKKEQAFMVGQKLAKEAAAKKINTIVFDRNGYVYTGRVAQVAEGAREGGLQF